MRDLRIIFMGTPDFAVASLKKIVESGYNVVAVITAPDRPAGRGRKLQQSAVKEYAVEKGLHVLQPTNLKSPDFLEELKALKPDLQVVVAFRMLPEIVWKLPKYGTFNLHASLLPQYRGAAPINWALINGEEKTGISTFFINENIDTGEMILQEETKIAAEDTAGSLHDRLMQMGGELVLKTVDLVRNDLIQRIPQQEKGELKPAPKLDRENTKIDWSKPVREIANLIRGLDPYPAAWSILVNDGAEMKVKIFEVEKELAEHGKLTGSISIEDKKVKVAAPDGFLFIKSIQLPGKRKMEVKDLLNGFSFSPDAKFV
ncbi:MAG: methionyl-tRNA formyltransferase [Salegentibacter sp.]